MHNNMSALYTRHITSLPRTRFHDTREPHNVAQQHECNIQKKKKKKKIYQCYFSSFRPNQSKSKL